MGNSSSSGHDDSDTWIRIDPDQEVEISLAPTIKTIYIRPKQRVKPRPIETTRPSPEDITSPRHLKSPRQRRHLDALKAEAVRCRKRLEKIRSQQRQRDRRTTD